MVWGGRADRGNGAMKLFNRLFTSSLGRKFLMALTGLILLGFVAGHMVGNLQVFLGPESLNRYGHFLQGLGELLWLVRLALLATVAVHIWAAVTLTLANRAARPISYADAALPAASYASRTMIWSGVIIAAFIVYHLLHYTVKAPGVNLTGQDFHAFTYRLADGTPRHDIYKMVILGFSQPAVAGFYAIAVGLLCWHLSHGVRALCQSLGFGVEAWKPLVDRFATGFAWVLFLGYVSIPIAVLCGYGKEVLK